MSDQNPKGLNGSSETNFQVERETYEAHKEELLENEGQFVVIHGRDIAGVWPTYEEALESGFDRFGLTPFFVKQILAVDPVYTMARGVISCPT